MSDDSELQRALGRIEGTLNQVLGELRVLRKDFDNHKNKDQENFSAVRGLVFRKHDDAISKIMAIETARAVLKGQLTLGQKILVAIGSTAGGLYAVYQAWQSFVRHGS